MENTESNRLFYRKVESSNKKKDHLKLTESIQWNKSSKAMFESNFHGHKGPLKNYVILLGGGGRSPKDYIRLQEGGETKRLHWITWGEGRGNFVQLYHRQSIKENPDYTD